MKIISRVDSLSVFFVEVICMSTTLDITIYTITKSSFKAVENFKITHGISYELNDNGYSNLYNYFLKDSKNKFDKDFFKKMLGNKYYDYTAVGDNILDISLIHSCINTVEKFSEENKILFYFKWETIVKTINIPGNSYTIFDSHIDVAFKVDGIVNENLYIYGHDVNDVINKVLDSIYKINQIKMYKPKKEMSLYNNNILFSEEASAILMHEAIGHLAEADLTVNHPSILSSFTKNDIVRNVGLTIYDDGNVKSSGWTPVDDEGTINSPTIIINKGEKNNLLYNAYMGKMLNKKSMGNARLLPSEGVPLVRMTNTIVEAGNSDLDELLISDSTFIYIDSLSTCYGYDKGYITPNRCYSYKSGIKTPVSIKSFITTSSKLLGGISYIGNKQNIIASTLTGCRKKTDYLLPVSMCAPKLFYKYAQLEV